jgi:xylulokinase
MLDAIGISESQLPPLCEPCSVAGTLLPDIAQAMHLTAETKVNVGTLDHFAGMVGTGNIHPGGITLSTGTVMAMATMCAGQPPKNSGIAMHYGFLPDTHVMLPVAESGGVSLEWFRRTCMESVDYDRLNQVLAQRPGNQLLFLPYLVGTNAPEFDAKASGLFMGLKTRHDAYDMAGAVMEGVALILDRILQTLANKPVSIISTGGGAKSPLWLQMKADITGIEVKVPEDKEAALLGTAIMGAVNAGLYENYEAAVATGVRMEKNYLPRPYNEQKKKAYSIMYDAMIQAEY